LRGESSNEIDLSGYDVGLGFSTLTKSQFDRMKATEDRRGARVKTVIDLDE